MEYEYKTLKGLTVRAMAAAAEGSFVGDEAVLDTEVTSAVIDSRKAVRLIISRTKNQKDLTNKSKKKGGWAVPHPPTEVECTLA